MTEAYLHGVESVETTKGPRPIKVPRTSVIGLVGTAPIHHVATGAPAVSALALIAGDKDAPLLGPDVTGYSIPRALAGIADQGAGLVVVINVFDPATMKTTVAAAAKAIEADGTADIGATDLISVTVTKSDDTACVEGTDYTVDRVTGIVTVIDGGLLDGEVTCKVGYDKANPAAVDDDAIIGTVDAGGVRTGAQAFLGAMGALGFVPKILIAPGHSGSKAVADALLVLGNKLRATTLADLPVGTTMTEALGSRTAGATPDCSSASQRLAYCYPFVKADDDVLEPYSARLAGAMAATDADVGYWKSPSNRPILGIKATEVPIAASISDATSDTNLLNGAGIMTIFSAYGTGFRTWGNRSSAFPGSSALMTFIAARRTLDVLEDAIEQYTLEHMDDVVGDVLVTAVLEDTNAFVRSLIQRGALMPGSVVTYSDEKNDPVELAAGHITFTVTNCPAPPAERITYDFVVDTNLLKLGA